MGKDDPVSGEGAGLSGVWRYEKATRAAVLVDAADYFQEMQEAMMSARKRVLLIGWDFDTRIALGRGRKWWQVFDRARPPRRLGRFIVWLANRNPDLEIRVLKWRFGALKMFLRGSMMIDLWRWWRHDRIIFKFDSAHPVGCSHHQKIVIIDDSVAVCGGIDMTGARWDTREHLDRDPLRREPGSGFYDPWHDMTMMVEGPVVGALDDVARERWKAAGGNALEPVEPQTGSAWPETLDPDFENVELGVARTRAEYGEVGEIREIEELFLSMIARARAFIYAESQYFASRKIAEAFARRMEEDNPPEIVVVNPRTADGWLEQQAMDTARARLLKSIGERDRLGRFRLYVPHAAEGTPIYVHAKLMIVDDTIMKIGSANMNNRSLGLDSECDLVLDAERPGNEGARHAIRRLRHSLLAEHLGLGIEDVGPGLDRYGSMHALIEAHAKTGRALDYYRIEDIDEFRKVMADKEWLDPEHPEMMFEPMARRRGLFRKRLRRPR